ncbi:MAG TPA: hypothetical protein VFR15_14510 [Chloroflexia bacterium]|nr:hypothetical protein [Chloroflexia bacterium]
MGHGFTALALALTALLAVLSAACTPNQATPASPTSTVPTVSTPAPTSVEATPTEPGIGDQLEARVTAFEIWQDYMPVVPPDGAPMYGVVTVEITHTEKLTPRLVEGKVTLTQASGGTIASDVAAEMQQQADDLGMLTPGAQTMTLTFGPATSQVSLIEGDMIGGELSLSVGGTQVQLALPEVALFFTH